MVMDFGFIKDLMMRQIHDPCDHGLILWKGDEVATHLIWKGRKSDLTFERWLKLYLIDDVPTAENLAKHWYHRLSEAIDNWMRERYAPDVSRKTRLSAIEVYETPNSIAVYQP